ncbi:unnamed protein product (macronuclear) [Paramecium tetraurelia]|uniref:Golgi apparatus membrane protein TVP23 homolog n=1 Tax=Paramecium tetraurelia TaxID=5888 RepID=A0DKM2_PARTE|nr:uncharacterized protein GSPATT00017919001 [Paramecium tetraurelia]CAK83589.1 unnamed protein product [Paramecium tetraurelia]|eukprot:XP_001450986.1 hypothetical protein (macronuclear) [Paramecium tetraurelia strain d4-2]
MLHFQIYYSDTLYFTPQYQRLYETIIVLDSIDFWIIKAIRKQLNQENQSDYVGGLIDFGNESWVFETSSQQKGEVQMIHSRIYWFAQLFMFLMLVGMFIINASWLQISALLGMFFPTAFNGYNLYAFNLCNKLRDPNQRNHSYR